MNKEDKRRYDRMINDIADDLLISAQREAFKITDNVYRDIMKVMHAKIEQYFNDHITRQ